MYKVSINADNEIVCLYDDAIYLDEGVEVYPISNEDFDKIWKSGYNSDWVYSNGSVEYKPKVKIPVKVKQQLPVEIL